jgi:hypothetical protein
LSISKAPKKAPNQSVSIKKPTSKNPSMNSFKISTTISPLLNTSLSPHSGKSPMSKPKDIDSAYFLEKSSKTKRMGLGSCSIPMGESIKESGRTTINKARDMKSSRTPPFMMARISKENHTATENMNGKMDKFIKASGSMDSKAGQEFGEAPRVTPTLESGTTARQTDTESILGLMAIDTKANLKSA